MTNELREEAARCAEEASRMKRGERGVLRSQLNSLVPEFSDDARGAGMTLTVRQIDVLLHRDHVLGVDRRGGEVVIIRRTRLAIFMRDALKRSSWGCQRALTRYAIDAANAALMGRFAA